MRNELDPLAIAVDWLDAYRAKDIDQLLELYAEDAVIECGCGGQKLIVGLPAIKEYWRHRFVEYPALALEDIQPSPLGALVAYRVNCCIVRSQLEFSSLGKITRVQCGPTS